MRQQRISSPVKASRPTAFQIRPIFAVIQTCVRILNRFLLSQPSHLIVQGLKRGCMSVTGDPAGVPAKGYCLHRFEPIQVNQGLTNLSRPEKSPKITLNSTRSNRIKPMTTLPPPARPFRYSIFRLPLLFHNHLPKPCTPLDLAALNLKLCI